MFKPETTKLHAGLESLSGIISAILLTSLSFYQVLIVIEYK